jgi:predicted aspartyl protease
MGFVYVPMLVKGPTGERRMVEMLADSGAAWSALPAADWKALGLTPERTLQFTLADGSHIEREVSECRFRYEGIEATSPVILGQGNDVALLGVVTLESLALVLNPLDRTLKPMPTLLMNTRRAKHLFSPNIPVD